MVMTAPPTRDKRSSFPTFIRTSDTFTPRALASIYIEAGRQNERQIFAT
jgi:hypothetical protein